jgi:hypothetical protein
MSASTISISDVRLLRLSLSAAAMILALAAPVSAQTQPGNILQSALEARKEVEQSKARQARRDPLARSGLTLPEPQLTFETVKTTGRATGTIGLVGQQAQGEYSLVFAMAAPIGSSETSVARPIDLRGLTSGASLSVGFSGTSLFKSFAVADIVKLCAGIPKEECTAGKLEEENSELSKKLIGTVFRKWPFLYGGTFTYGRNKFSFFDTSGVRQPTADHNNLTFEGAFGLLVNRRTNLVALHVAYSDTYTASPDKTELCRPLSNTQLTRCDSVTMGAPIHEKSAITTLEYRWQLAGAPKIPIAIAPKLQFALGIDGGDDLSSFEVPVYFFQEKADPKATSTAPRLNGGAAAGWRSDDGFQVYVFIGTTFRLFKI